MEQRPLSGTTKHATQSLLPSTFQQKPRRIRVEGVCFNLRGGLETKSFEGGERNGRLKKDVFVFSKRCCLN